MKICIGEQDWRGGSQRGRTKSGRLIPSAPAKTREEHKKNGLVSRGVKFLGNAFPLAVSSISVPSSGLQARDSLNPPPIKTGQKGGAKGGSP